MCHQNFYQPSEKINIRFQCGECWGYLFSLLVSPLRCFDKFLCHKMQKFVLIKIDFGGEILSKAARVPNAAI